LPKGGLYAFSWYLVAVDAAGRSSPRYTPPGPPPQEQSC
jgi:hypothetical protein